MAAAFLVKAASIVFRSGVPGVGRIRRVLIGDGIPSFELPDSPMVLHTNGWKFEVSPVIEGAEMLTLCVFRETNPVPVAYFNGARPELCLHYIP